MAFRLCRPGRGRRRESIAPGRRSHEPEGLRTDAHPSGVHQAKPRSMNLVRLLRILGGFPPHIAGLA